MAKYKLFKQVATNKLGTVIPKALVHLVDIGAITEEVVTLALFPSDRKHVTLSGHVKSLVENVNELAPLVIVGSVFTRDASQLLRKSTRHFYCWDEFFWTDESYIDIQVDISSKNSG